MSDTILTDNNIQVIIEKYKNNIDIEEILKEYNCNERDIRLIFKENKIDRKPNRYSKELEERIVKLYREYGYMQYQIMNDLVITDKGITNTLKRHQVPKRSYSDNNKKRRRNSLYFDYIDCEEKAYILGFIYADGNNNTKHNALQIGLQEDDKQLLEMIKDELEYDGDLIYIPSNNRTFNGYKVKDQYRLTVNDEHISKQLEKLGVFANKSLTLTFPRFLRPDLIRHFIRGAFDGDGGITCSQDNRWTTSYVGTYDFCNCIKQMLDAMFIKSSIVHPTAVGDKNTYYLFTGGNKSSYYFLSWLYNDCNIKMERKYKKFLELKEYYLSNENLILPNELYE